MDLAATATTIVLTHFRRIPAGTPDEITRRVLTVLDDLAQGDPPTRSALMRLRSVPGDPEAAALLNARIETAVRHLPAFRDDLGRSLIVEQESSTRLWLLAGAGLLVIVVAVVVTGAGFFFIRDHTTWFDVKTDLQAADGWSYRVSEAHLKTTPQIDGRNAAQPGYHYLYFDITVENRLSDREEPGIGFSFARAQNTLTSDCGASGTGFFGPISSYTAGVVAGWCVSRSNSLFGGGTSCYETNDTVFRGIDNIPAGGENDVRCVDSLLVADDVDLTTIRVYYVDAGSPQRIPTTT